MNPIRRAAMNALPEGDGIFLRCDRGNGLYVTNCLTRSDEKVDWEAAGFFVHSTAGLSFLTPNKQNIDSFDEWIRGKVKKPELAATVQNAIFSEMLADDIALLINGIKRLELHGNIEEYEKRVRQRAAVCLRKRRGGGTLKTCAMLVDLMKEGMGEDEN